LVGALGVVDGVERVDLGLQLGQGVGERLLVQVAEQGLVEAFVLALGGRLVGLAGDRLGAQRGSVRDELAERQRRDGLSASPLSDSSRCGTPWAATALSKTAIASLAVSPDATWDATA
jgi:hypothetical protein